MVMIKKNRKIYTKDKLTAYFLYLISHIFVLYAVCNIIFIVMVYI